MNAAKKKEQSSTAGIEPSTRSLNEIIRKYTVEAIWIDSQNKFVHLIECMAEEIALYYGKQRLDFSTNDLLRLVNEFNSTLEKFGLSKINISKAYNGYIFFKTYKKPIDIISYTLPLIKLISGNPNQLILKMGFDIPKKHLFYASLVYFAGHYFSKVYGNNVSSEVLSLNVKDNSKSFNDGVLELMNCHQIETLHHLLGIKLSTDQTNDERRLSLIHI